MKTARFAALAKRIRRNGDSLPGEWLFKCTLKSGGVVSQDERAYMGIASVKLEGTNLAVISTEGETEANFSGDLVGSRITGQLGVAGNSAKAEGVAVADKISITFRSVTQSGTVQGTFVLQR